MNRPLRVLHLTGALDRGGVETWLLNLLRHTDRGEVAQDFLTTGAGPGLYEPELQALGARILRAPDPGRPGRFAQQLGRALDQGPYDALVSHIHSYGGYALALARRRGVAGRVALSHNDTRAGDRAADPLRRAYLAASRRLLLTKANARLAVSPEAGEALFGRAPFQVFRLGIDLKPFQDPTPQPELRAEVGLPEGAPVVGHVGRMDAQKNHAFLLRAFQALRERHAPSARLLLVGDGPLRAGLTAEAERLGLAGSVHFLGSRPDVPSLLRWAMDVFVFPSHFEGLSLALTEAQLTGLPCVISADLTAGSRLEGGHVTSVALSAGPDTWADAIQAALQTGRRFPDPEQVDIAGNVRELNALYWRLAGKP